MHAQKGLKDGIIFLFLAYVDELILEMPYEEFIQEDFMGIWEAMTIVMGMHWGHRIRNRNFRRDAILEFDLVDYFGFVNTFFSERVSNLKIFESE